MPQQHISRSDDMKLHEAFFKILLVFEKIIKTLRQAQQTPLNF